MRRIRGPVLAAIVAAVVVLAAVVLLLMPRYSATSERREQLREAEQQEEALQAQLAELREARRQARALQRGLARLEAKVPPTADQPSLIRLLQAAADRAAVDLDSVLPGAPVTGTQAGVAAVPVQMILTGSFFQVEEFLFRLETLPRAMKVTSITVSPAGEGFPELSLSLTAEVYTTDVSAGPGSEPGPTGEGAVPGATPTPEPTPTEET